MSDDNTSCDCTASDDSAPFYDEYNLMYGIIQVDKCFMVDGVAE